MVYTVQEVLTQVRLLWLHSESTAYHLLSRNVVREVCTYLQGHTALAFFTDANIEIHHLTTQTVRKAKPSKVVKFCVTTHMTFREIICVGAYPKSTSVSSVDLTTSTVTKEASMQVSRACPGIINVRGHIYVFGGLIDGEDVLRCEKFSIKARQWTFIPDMDEPRIYFTPAVHLCFIYLCSLFEGESISSFHTPTEQYTQHPLTIPDINTYTSVSFIVDTHIYVLGNEDSFLVWELGSREGFKEIRYARRNSPAFSCTEVVKVGKGVYWTDYNTKNVVRFDLETGSLEFDRK